MSEELHSEHMYQGMPMFAEGLQTNPHFRVFVAAFDGTANDRDAVPQGERASLVADFERELPHTAHLQSKYYEGVGTREDKVWDLVGSITGAESMERAERAYSDFNKQVDAWRKADPQVEVQVHVMGFSRGCGSAVQFLNMVDQGVQPPRGSIFEHTNTPSQLSQGQIKSTAVLLDPVTTFQFNLNHQLPRSTISVLQVEASLEARDLFSSTDFRDSKAPGSVSREIGAPIHGGSPWVISKDMTTPAAVFTVSDASSIKEERSYSRVQEVIIPGAHSDIGGTYPNGGLREVTKYFVDRYHRDVGLTPQIALTMPDTSKVFAHNSKLEDSALADSFFDKFRRVEQGELPSSDKPLTREVHIENFGQWDGSAQVIMDISADKTGHLRHDMVHTVFNTQLEPSQKTEDLLLQDKRLTLALNRDGHITPVSGTALAEPFGFNKQTDRIQYLGKDIDSLGGTAELKATILKDGPVTIRAIAIKTMPIVEMPPEDRHHVGSRLSGSPETSLHDFFSKSLPQMGYPPHELSKTEIKEMLSVLSSAQPGQLLGVTNTEISLLRKDEPLKQQEVAFKVDDFKRVLQLDRNAELPAKSIEQPQQEARVH